MKPGSVFYMAMYDITNPRVLQKVGKLMAKSGLERINYSVWLGWENPLKNDVLKGRLTKLLKKEEAGLSKFYILPVGAAELRRMRSVNGRKPAGLEYWMGELKTMFF